MLKKLSEIAARYDELTVRLAAPDAYLDEDYVRLNKERAELGEIVSAYRAYEATKADGLYCLITGNHDNYLNDRRFDASRFEWIRPYAELHDNRRKVILSHYPIFCYNGQYRRNKEGAPVAYMLYGHVHDTRDEMLVNRFICQTRQTLHQSPGGGEARPIPCQMINCFCMFSDYTPLTLDEWIAVDEARRREMEEKSLPTDGAQE